MSFAAPAMLAALLTALIPILIHLIHKRRPKPRPFAAIELLQRSVQRVERRWRLKRFLLLASRVTILAAFALAAARPLFGAAPAELAGPRAAELVAIVVDASLSMRATPGGGASAFARAKDRARAILGRLGPEDRAVIIAAERDPRALLPAPTADARALSDALGELEPSWAYADLAASVTAAAQALASVQVGEPAPAARVIVLSDLAGHGIRSAADLSLGPGRSPAKLELVDVLEGVERRARDNRAITELDAIPAAGRGPRAIELRAKLRSFVPEGEGRAEAVPTDITLADEVAELVAGSVDLPPGGVADKSLIHSFDDAGYAALKVYLTPDALPEDDARYAIADVRRAIRLLIVDGQPSGVPKEDETFYLEAALGAADQAPPRVITADDLSREDLEGAYDVVILAGVPAFAPSDGPRLARFVERGGGLWITATERLDAELYSGELAGVLPRALRGVKLLGVAGSSDPVGLARPMREHPILSAFDDAALPGLLSAKLRGLLLFEPNGPRAMDVLLETTDGQPALVESRVGKGRVLVLATSIDRDLGDLPIQPGFLPLVRRAVLHLGDALARPRAEELLVGDTKTFELPPGIQRGLVRGPDGVERPLSREAPSLRLDRPGHYAVELGPPLERRPELDVAVNVDPRESDLRPLSAEEAAIVLEGAPGDGGQGRWAALARLGALADPDALPAILLAVMLLAFALEGALTFERKRTAP